LRLLQDRRREAAAVVLTAVLGQRHGPLAGLGHLHVVLAADLSRPPVLLEVLDRAALVE
jgi:hypothetical protein